MELFSKKRTRLGGSAAVLGACVVLASCGGSAAVESAEDPETSTEPPASELTVMFESEWPVNHVPPWEDFEVGFSEVTFREVVTAAADMPDGLTLLGDSCEQLQADYPEISECVEDVSRVRDTGPEINPGSLSPDGTLTIPAPDVAIQLSISATNLTDDACFFDAFVEITPGQSDLVVPIEEACA